jgi:hypothetical protein
VGLFVLACSLNVPVHFPYIMGAGRGAKGRPARRSAMAARR